MAELLLLLEVLFVGRVALSLLPPGRIGSHRPDGLAATLAASLLVGTALQALAELPRAFAGLPEISTRTLTLLAAAVLLVRLATLPGAFVATPPPRVDPAGPRGLLLRWLAALAITTGVVLRSDTPMLVQLAPCLALPVVLDHALRELAVRAGARAWIWILAAVLVWGLPADGLLHTALPWLALELGAGMAWLLVWRTRADRRALALGAIAFGAAMCAAPATWPLGLTGLALLCLGTPQGGRANAAPWAVAAAVLFAPVALSLRSDERSLAVDSSALPPALQPPGTLALMAALVIPLLLLTLPALLARRTQTARTPS